jgi:hypothetical protein
MSKIPPIPPDQCSPYYPDDRRQQLDLSQRLLPGELALRRIISMEEAAQLSGLSVDTLKRRYRHLILTLSPRRIGMRLGDVLALGEPTAA